jgi:GTP-binding protein EngB required for normal cell division
MDGIRNTPDRIEAVRQGTVCLLENLVEKARAFELPEPPAALEQYRLKLVDNTYNVLVVGEAKRGKSSFINALIARPILPTDVDIATSQVFRIAQSEHEAYRIRFEDGSQQEIHAADLPRYGSQVVADVEGTPRLDQLIRWIEVDMPMQFLPRGVNMLDTPGLGALYAAHAQITQRFVPHADAVIFVLDSGQPIIQPELEFVERILGVTRNIFFIQTKIDQHDQDHWQNIQRRNQEILAERFKDRLADVRVWPVSSSHLLTAAQTGDDDYLQISGQQELVTALQTLLFRVAGWSRSAEAILIAGHYHGTSLKTLAGRLASFEGSDEKRAELQRQVTQRKRQFDEDWGDGGKRRQQLMASVDRIVALAKPSFLAVLQPGGEIDKTQRAKIDALESVEAAQQLSEAMPGNVAAAAVENWRRISRESRTQCLALIIPFVEAADTVSFSEEMSIFEMTAGHQPGIAVQDDWGAIITKADQESTWAGDIAEILLPQRWGIWVDVVALVWGFVQGWLFRDELRVQTAREQLNEGLSRVLQGVQQQFLTPNLAYGGLSPIDKYFDSLVQAMAEHIQAIAAQKSEDAQAELARTEEAVRLDDQQRSARTRQVQQQIAEWDGIGSAMKALMADLQALDQAPAPAAALAHGV